MKAMMKMLRQAAWAQTLILAALVPGLILWPMPVRSNPSGAAVAHGIVEIDESVPGQLKINQGSDKAIINWQDFSIGAGELTEFLQPGVDAVALNRVISGNPSTLLGTLKANGGVILVNQNGILVGGGGVVDIGGLAVMSTLDIDDADFLNGGPMNFKGNSAAGVTNLGTITSRGGDVVLLGNFVDNQGAVGAPDGTVAFGAGGEFIVDTIGDSRLSVIAGGQGGEKGITNSGTVSAAAVEFKAHGNVYALAIQNTGIVRANGVSRRNGRIILSAAGDGSVGGRIENTGTLQARNADG
ncbi:MAG: filamentous hemagglutinin N-terminal domain-containing protein, partial [Verrucomicrobiae bacterium]|nr:filamentous hemagglutinin N-terminal domain-containing protein [Verrucomicrobiae bacterium]